MNKEYIINHFINLYYKSFNDIEIGSSSIIGVVGEDINNVITSENEIKEMADDIVNYAINLYPKTIQ